MNKGILLFRPRANTKEMIVIAQFLLFILLLNAQVAFGQTKTISGNVVDQNGIPLPGASIILQNTKTGAVTDFDGAYTISIPENEKNTLDFSYVGFLTQSILVGDKSIINITLTEDVAALGEVVVVGYGTQKKESLTAAVGVISNEELQTTTNVSIAQKLAGKLVGVQIRQQSGQPGSFDNDINIRGFGNPIYIIDGIRRGGARDFQQLNGDDIESISILKDAAASIYGLGAQNGVILVTTKKGTKGRPSFNYSSVFSFVEPTDIPEMASAAQYVQMWNDTQLFIPGGSGTPFYSEDEVQNWINGGPGFEGTNWNDLTIKKNTTTVQHNFSATGGTEKTNYFISFGYVDEDGLLKSNDMGYKRYNFRTNLTTEFAKNLTGSVLLSGRWDERWEPGASFFNIFKGSRVALPTESVYANNNTDFLATISGASLNPVALMERDISGYSERTTRRFTSQFSLEYQAPFAEGLSFKAVAAYDAENFQSKEVLPSF